jgi:hypothetical protein
MNLKIRDKRTMVRLSPAKNAPDQAKITRKNAPSVHKNSAKMRQFASKHQTQKVTRQQGQKHVCRLRPNSNPRTLVHITIL